MEPRFQIRLTGPFRLLRDGKLVPDRMLGSKKGRTLLKLLALNAGTPVTIDKIVEALWAEAPPARPENNVASLVSRLRAVLGAAAIEGGRRAYSLSPGPLLEIDLHEAARLTTEAEARLRNSEPTLARVATERATKLLEVGELLEDEADSAWADDARETVAHLVRRARRCLWLSALELADYPTALDAANAAIKDDELDEEAHRTLMLAHYRAGAQGAALAAFERLRGILEKDLGTDPSPESRTLHLAILRNEEPAPLLTPPRAPVTKVMDPGFVGRDKELAELSQHWVHASAGTATLLLITGEAGIGKSRLAAETARMAHSTGGVVLQSRCYQAERSLFLQPLGEAIRSAVVSLNPDETREIVGEWAGTLGELVPEVTRVLRPIDYELGPAPVERRRAFEAVTSFFQNLSRQRPVLLVIDDLHLAGAETGELLHFMLRRLARDRVFIIGTVRSEEAPDFLYHLIEIGKTVPLGPLPEAAVKALARQADAADFTDELMSKTRGHTLFVVEALRSIAETGDRATSIPIPDSLRNAVLARTRRLGLETERFLRAVVVLGSNFEIDLAAHLAAVSVQEALRHAELALEARLLVQAETTYEFANDLIREVLYESTPKPSRVAVHRQAADLMEGKPETIAIHRTNAGDWKAAAEAWLEAATVAARSFAHRDADRLLGEAVNAAASSGDQVLLARSCVARSRVRETLGEYRTGYSDASRALEIAREEGASDLEAEALEALAWIAYSSRYDEDANDLARQASHLSERAAEAAGARPSAIVLTARLRHSRGDLEGARSLLEDALSGELDDSTKAAGLSSLGCVLAHGDQFEDAVRTLETAIKICRKSKNLRHLTSALFFAGMVYGNLGRFSHALTTFDVLSRLVEESDSRSYRARVANLRSWIYRELGDTARARDFAQEGNERAGELGEVEPKGHAALALAECALLDGDDAAGLRMLEDAESMMGRDVGFSWRLELRYLELQARLDPERAEALIELARKYGSRKYEAIALAHLGRHQDALAIAAPLGSDYLTAIVGNGPVAKKAIERLALGLPAGLRESFVTRGRATLARSR